MIIKPAGPTSHDLTWRDVLERNDVNRLRTSLGALNKSDPDTLVRQLCMQSAHQAALPSVLHVSVTPDELSRGIDVHELKAVLDRNASRLDGIALVLETSGPHKL
jgi:hypothetical protein